MYYHSTRNNNDRYTASQAILKGLADDGGLFVPNEIPNVSNELDEMAKLSYAKLCHKVVCKFFEEFAADKQFEQDVIRAYQKFDTSDAVQLKKINDVCYMELFHGPTCAFKDFALSVLPYEIMAAKRNLGINKDFAILTATSGDTGKAALEAFRGQDGFKIAVVYPKCGVSKIQELQMNSTSESNTFVCGLEGNFDECQTLVKEMFADKYDGVEISSANSINIGRLVPQIAYYFFTYLQLVKDGQISMGQKINFCVPTGNFGDILAGYIAKQMGLPVAKLICASNKNNILTDFFATGIYDKRREFYLTKSPSMDILISSNFERLLWLATRDDKYVSKRMQDLKDKGFFEAKDLLPKLDDFIGGFADEEETSKEIARVFNQHDYLIDTHTAVASSVAYKSKVDGYTVVLSTASPYKFCTSVLESLGKTADETNEFKVLDDLQEVTHTTAPPSLSALKTAKRFHNNSGSVKEVKKMIKTFLEHKNA